VYCLPVRVTPPWNPEKNLYIRQNVMDCKTSKDFRKLCTCRGYRSLAEMLNCFEVFLPIVRGNIDLIEQLAFDFCKRQWEQNVVYCEVRYSPHLLAKGFTEVNIDDGSDKQKITPQTVFDAVTRVCTTVMVGCIVLSPLFS
jgi:adenosine deaminase